MHNTTSSALRIVEAMDADEHAGNLTNWEQRYDQTTAGVFHGLLEELQREIDKQIEEGGTGLLAEDQYLAEINLVDLETSSGEQHEYWLLAIRAAKKAKMLSQTEPRAEDLEPG